MLQVSLTKKTENFPLQKWQRRCAKNSTTKFIKFSKLIFFCLKGDEKQQQQQQQQQHHQQQQQQHFSVKNDDHLSKV
jgi:hypothetical protein